MLEKTQKKKHGACFVAMVTKQHAFFNQVTSEVWSRQGLHPPGEALQRLFWLSNQRPAVCVRERERESVVSPTAGPFAFLSFLFDPLWKRGGTWVTCSLVT